MKNFDTVGIMIDCSRGAVYTVDAVKKFIVIMSRMGYNMLSLYTEDTYEIEGEPYFGSKRGRYTADELRELDDFAAEHGVELIPCIQTLGHLGTLRRNVVYDPLFDIGGILLADDEKVYAFIEKMFASISKTFRSRRVNIGMDEAAQIGQGRYRERHGDCNRYDILERHLLRVVSIAEKYGFSPMMWSDMFFRFATNGQTYRVDELIMSETERKMIPSGTSLVYWDYYTTTKKRYDIMFDNHKLLVPEDKIWYAGGIWTWTGFAPHNDASLRLVSPGISSCIEKGVRNIFFAMWGDNGGECSIFSVLPAMYDIARQIGMTNSDFCEIAGVSREQLMLLELPDAIESRPMRNEKNCWEYLRNPSKYMLYSDPLLGRYDSTVRGGEGAVYAEYAEKLAPLCESGEYSLHFRAARALCEALQYKYELGVKLRRAYAEGRDAIAKLIPELDRACSAVNAFHESYRALWFSEKKPQGFEIHDIRLAGVAARLASAKLRVEEYVSGKIPSIAELEEPILDCEGGGYEYEGGPLSYVSYSDIISATGI